MPFSAYDSDGLRLLSAALVEALDNLRKSRGRPLSEIEKSDFSKKLIAKLTTAFDDGEREPEALKRAALQGVYISAAKGRVASGATRRADPASAR